ncbi:esterase [Novosphingobium sp. Leaf2]|nr:esterase [Novosphingobium sp. Leaf2]
MDKSMFGDHAIPAEVQAFNAAQAERFGHLPSLWEMGIEQARSGGVMPSPPSAHNAYDLSAGDVALHVVPHASPRAVVLHIHGGGFILGGAAKQDPMLEAIAIGLGVTCASIEYRLAPENPYPAAWDDCEAAASWLVENAAEHFGASRLLIMGESAGALLAVSTLVRLRARGLADRFAGAALSFGVYDSGMTPSQRLAETGVLKGRDITRIADSYAPGIDRRDPDVSPLYADLLGLPPALFTVGTLDAMLDDSMFMYGRWLAAGNRAELALYPGADHAFIETPHPSAKSANARIQSFLSECLEQA